jgi:hypothetical protein
MAATAPGSIPGENKSKLKSNTHSNIMRKLALIVTQAILAGGLITLQSNCSAITYDAALDFSLNSNPNGVWSYGFSTTLGGALVLDDENIQDSSGLYIWRNAGQEPNGPSFAFNPTASTITITGVTEDLVWNPYQLSMDPGSAGQYCVLRLNAPESGEYQIQGAFSSVDQYFGAKTDVHILLNGTSFFDSEVYGTTSVTDFDQTIQLNAGDVVDFAVGTDGLPWGWDTTGLDAQITPVPEPSVIGLLVVGLSLIYLRHYKRTAS